MKTPYYNKLLNTMQELRNQQTPTAPATSFWTKKRFDLIDLILLLIGIPSTLLLILALIG